ncbi:hypothetical protein LIER_14613 [Lithospermum erythrorhizon]|uniref:Uncharacterized protein n=1 Tax=Lithospermum erythrorhizon TaxID=34254 RepID=A0AAV3Q214_LITER
MIVLILHFYAVCQPWKIWTTIEWSSRQIQASINKPTSNEVAGEWIENEMGSRGQTFMRDICVYAQSGCSHYIQPSFACYDPLQYVLMFLGGEPGWHGNIPTVGSVLVGEEPTEIGSVDPTNVTSFEDLLTVKKSGW